MKISSIDRFGFVGIRKKTLVVTHKSSKGSRQNVATGGCNTISETRGFFSYGYTVIPTPWSFKIHPWQLGGLATISLEKEVVVFFRVSMVVGGKP